MITAAEAPQNNPTIPTPAAEQTPPESPAPAKKEAVFRDVDLNAEPLKFNKTFLYEYESVEDGKLYSGQFTCKRLTIGDLSEMGVIKAHLNGGEKVDRWIDFMHEQMAYLRVALVKVPEWWKPEDSYDLGLLRYLYDYVREWEATFRRGGVG